MSDQVRFIITDCQCGLKHDFVGERTHSPGLPCGNTAKIAPLRKSTQYVCPDDTGLGHSSHWTGAKTILSSRDGYCLCGTELVEKVEDGVHVLRWEMVTPGQESWHPVEKKHFTLADAERQRDGLNELISEGELIRNVTLQSFDLAPRGAA